MIDWHDIGSKDRRIVLRSPNTTRDATYNQPSSGWTTVATVWAARSFGSGSEKFSAEKEMSVQKYTYYIGFDSTWSAISTKWTFTDSSTVYEITGIKGDKRMGYFIIEAVIKS